MVMNKELIQRLYNQSVNQCVQSGKDDAWTWESAFAEAIVLECSRVAKLEVKDNRVCDAIEGHFGIVS